MSNNVYRYGFTLHPDVKSRLLRDNIPTCRKDHDPMLQGGGRTRCEIPCVPNGPRARWLDGGRFASIPRVKGEKKQASEGRHRRRRSKI